MKFNTIGLDIYLHVSVARIDGQISKPQSMLNGNRHKYLSGEHQS